jgi:hypothetical protein
MMLAGFYMTYSLNVSHVSGNPNLLLRNKNYEEQRQGTVIFSETKIMSGQEQRQGTVNREIYVEIFRRLGEAVRVNVQKNWHETAGLFCSTMHLHITSLVIEVSSF